MGLACSSDSLEVLASKVCSPPVLLLFSPEPVFTNTGEYLTPESKDKADAMLMLLGEADLKVMLPLLPLPPDPDPLKRLPPLAIPPPTIGVNDPFCSISVVSTALLLLLLRLRLLFAPEVGSGGFDADPNSTLIASPAATPPLPFEVDLMALALLFHSRREVYEDCQESKNNWNVRE